MQRFEQSLPMMLYRTLDAVMPRFRAIFARHGLTEQQWRVLRALWERDGLPLLALSRATLVSAPSLVGVIDRLQRDGLVRRRRSDRDRRIVQVWLTGRGRGLEAAARPEVEAAYATLESLASESEWRALQSVMEKIVARSKCAGDRSRLGPGPATEAKEVQDGSQDGF